MERRQFLKTLAATAGVVAISTPSLAEGAGDTEITLYSVPLHSPEPVFRSMETRPPLRLFTLRLNSQEKTARLYGITTSDYAMLVAEGEFKEQPGFPPNVLAAAEHPAVLKVVLLRYPGGGNDCAMIQRTPTRTWMNTPDYARDLAKQLRVPLESKIASKVNLKDRG